MTAMVYIICPAGLLIVLWGIYMVRPMGVWSTGESPNPPDRGKGMAQGKGVFADRQSKGSQTNLLIRVYAPLNLAVT